MPVKKINVTGVGEVLVTKRRGTKNLRLSVNADGQVRVGIPYWTPYHTAILFIKNREAWIQKQLLARPRTDFKNGQHIGKSHRLLIHVQTVNKRTQITPTEIHLWSNLGENDPKLQLKARLACQKALAQESEKLLRPRLKELSLKHDLPFKGSYIKKLTSRWGSCSQDKKITLSYFLIQLPWPLIDYVLIHELMHTKHLYHGPKFWKAMQEILPRTSDLRKEIKKHRPAIETIQTAYVA